MPKDTYRMLYYCQDQTIPLAHSAFKRHWLDIMSRHRKTVIKVRNDSCTCTAHAARTAGTSRTHMLIFVTSWSVRSWALQRPVGTSQSSAIWMTRSSSSDMVRTEREPPMVWLFVLNDRSTETSLCTIVEMYISTMKKAGGNWCLSQRKQRSSQTCTTD